MPHPRLGGTPRLLHQGFHLLPRLRGRALYFCGALLPVCEPCRDLPEIGSEIGRLLRCRCRARFQGLQPLQHLLGRLCLLLQVCRVVSQQLGEALRLAFKFGFGGGAV